MNFLKEFFSKESTKMFISFIIIVLFFYMIRSMLDLFLLTFLFTYLMNSLQNLIIGKFHIVTDIKEKLVTIILYLLLFTSISLLIVKYVPQLVAQSENIADQIRNYDFNSIANSNFMPKYLLDILKGIDFKSYIKPGFNITLQLATNIGTWGINIFIATMLSLFFMLEKRKIIYFLSRFKNSRIAPFYKYFSFFGNNFMNSFGKVIQAQILIAIVNTSISVVMLSILHFPRLIVLGFMTFTLSLIPVAGVIISLFPLSIIAFNVGGLTEVLYVIIMVAIIHIIETYILNPNLMSAKIKLPIFFTFVILIVSRHFIGVWGLLIGIPLFMFVLDLLDVKMNQ